MKDVHNIFGMGAARPRQVLRKRQVLEATGFSNSTLYAKIADGLFPKPTRMDPKGRIVVWFADEIAAYQQNAIAWSNKVEAA